MSNLLPLIKIEFSKVFSKASMKENKAKSASFLSVIALVIILGIALSSLYSYVFGKTFIDNNLNPFPLTITFAGFASMLTLYSGVTQTRGIFIGGDYNLLSALPIKKSEIIASKVINLYLVELLYSFIILMPNGIVNLILTNDVKYLFIGIILTLFISAFPLVVAMIVSFISALVSSKFKYGNFVSLIIYILFFVGVFSFSFFMNSGNSASKAMTLTNISNVLIWLNPAVYFVELSMDNFMYIFIFIGINIVSIVVVVLVISLFFDRIYELITSIHSNVKYERKNLKVKKQLKSLLGLEFKRLGSSKLYFLNSVAGLIASVLMSGIMGFIFSKWSPFAQGPNDQVLQMVSKYAYAGAIVVLFGASISNTCAIGISMEGKNFWLVKSLPIDYKKYMWAKLLLALILNVGVSIISSTIIVIFLMPDVLSIIAIYLIPILAVTTIIFISLLINLTFYKLRWTNEQEVVKSSKEVLLSMLVGFAFDIGVAGLLIGLGIVSNLLGIFVTLGVLIALCALFYIILNKTFENKLMKIEDF